MPNPLVSGGTAPSGATSPVNPVNGLYPSTLRSKTNFPIFKQVLNTCRFGNITPVDSFECVPDDDIALNVDRRLDSYTLSSPMLSQLRWHHAHFCVPKQAIYFNTYSKLFVNPKKGDDVIPQEVRALVNFYSLYQGIYQFLSKSSNNIVQYALGFAFCYQMYNFSENPAYLLRLIAPAIRDSFDVPNELAIVFNEIQWPTVPELVSITANNSSAPRGIVHQYYFGSGLNNLSTFTRIIDDILFYSASITDIEDTKEGSEGLLYSIFNKLFPRLSSFSFLPNFDVNIEHLIAFQLGCCQFFTNSDVDFVYTSELFRQNMDSIQGLFIDDTITRSFNWNGIRIFYDWCSSALLSNCYIGPNEAYFNQKVGFWLNLISLPRSLKYGDMVNSGYVEPIAVGDTTIPVNGDAIGSLSTSAVDTTIGILRERYLHLVNSAPSTIQAYSAAVFGVVPDVLPPEPRFITHHVDNINDVVNVNTAENQGMQNANLSSRSSRNEYVTHVNQESIIVSCDWFDVISAYRSNLSPFALKKDRFDYFIPQLQNIGMQSVPTPIVDMTATGANPLDNIFSYLPNDYEYKQSLSVASGAFATGFLPSWCFISDVDLSHITPLTIRFEPCDFDRFYKSLTSLNANRFHYIVSSVFHYNASRPMEFSPGVLMRS